MLLSKVMSPEPPSTVASTPCRGLPLLSISTPRCPRSTLASPTVAFILQVGFRAPPDLTMRRPICAPRGTTLGVMC